MGIILGPMEGISDSAYRACMFELFPQWDYIATEFLRAPTNSHFKDSHILKFFGHENFKNLELKNKSIFQILTSVQSNYSYLAEQIDGLGFSWLDLNLGCPSRTVNSHGGGAYLLDYPEQLREIVTNLRKSFSGFFSVKMRLGFHDTHLFENNIDMLINLGVDAITVHGRTRDQLYKGIADWSLFDCISQKYNNNFTFIGNGDLWDISSFNNKKEKYQHLMLSRPALKFPWFPLMINQASSESFFFCEWIEKYYNRLCYHLEKEGFSAQGQCKKMKALSRYIFDIFSNAEQIKKELFRIQDLDAFMQHVSSLVYEKNL